jgi:hypothetical protein
VTNGLRRQRRAALATLRVDAPAVVPGKRFSNRRCRAARFLPFATKPVVLL